MGVSLMNEECENINPNASKYYLNAIILGYGYEGVNAKCDLEKERGMV